MNCSMSCSSVHGILQARILEWVTILFSTGSSQPRIWTKVSWIASRLFTIRATREARVYPEYNRKSLKDFRLGSTFLRSAFQNYLTAVWAMDGERGLSSPSLLKEYMGHPGSLLKGAGEAEIPPSHQWGLHSQWAQAVFRHQNTIPFSSVSPHYTWHLYPLKQQKTSDRIIEERLLKSVLLLAEFYPPKIDMLKP